MSQNKDIIELLNLYLNNTNISRLPQKQKNEWLKQQLYLLHSNGKITIDEYDSYIRSFDLGGYLDGGKKGVPNPPKKHWTALVKQVKNKYNLTWKQAIKKWSDLGKPNPNLPLDKERPNLRELDQKLFLKKINDAKTFNDKLKVYNTLTKKWKQEYINQMPLLKQWIVKFKFEIEDNNLLNKIDKQSKNKEKEIKQKENEYINTLTKKRKDLLNLIKQNIPPKLKEFDDLKILFSSLLGKRKKLFKDYPYEDKLTQKDISIEFKMISNLLNNISKYLTKYKNKTVTNRKTIKKIIKVDKEDKVDNSNKSVRQLADDLYWFEQPDEIDDLDGDEYEKELLKYYNKLMNRLDKALLLMNNKKNKTEKEEYILNELDADKIDLQRKIDKLKVGGGPCCSSDEPTLPNWIQQTNRNVRSNNVIQPTNRQIARQTTQRLLEQQREEARRNDLPNFVRSRINFPDPRNFRRN